MKKVDARGIPCPGPVIETKKAFEKYPGAVIQVAVDDEAARVNVGRFASSRGYALKEKEYGDVHYLTLTPTVLNESDADLFDSGINKSSETVFLLTSYGIGTPSEELGKLLIKTFFQTIPQADVIPSSIIFMNGSVKHTVEGSDTLESLKKLNELGIDIIVCGTCLDYYNLKEKLRVGRISNFFEITTILTTNSRTVTI